jgi:hypothetical protein
LKAAFFEAEQVRVFSRRNSAAAKNGDRDTVFRGLKLSQAKIVFGLGRARKLREI